MTKTQKSILKTLAFFDIFKRPLTLEEVWHFLYRHKTGKMQVLLGLQNLQKEKQILKIKNLYCLVSSKKIVKEFEEKRDFRIKRWQKVFKTIKYLKWAPFVKNIAVINSLAFRASKEDSDIDILIITQKNRLWTARAFTVAILEILGQNKNKWYKAGKFCLGFAFDEEKLNLSELRLKGDIYFIYWLATIFPVLDRKIYQKFILANPWILKELPNWRPLKIQSQKSPKNILEKILMGKWGKRLEEFLAKMQIKRIWALPENFWTGFKIVTDNHLMNLHAYDNLYSRKWQEKLKELGIGG